MMRMMMMTSDPLLDPHLGVRRLPRVEQMVLQAVEGEEAGEGARTFLTMTVILPAQSGAVEDLAAGVVLHHPEGEDEVVKKRMPFLQPVEWFRYILT